MVLTFGTGAQANMRQEIFRMKGGVFPMKTWLIAASALAVLGGCASVGPTSGELARDGANSDNVLTYGQIGRAHV